MPLSAFALALAAAVLHAGWNALVARAGDVRAATAVVLGLSVVLFAPVAAATWRVEQAAIPWIVASSALELVYFVLLASAYQRFDLSLVYPTARGAAPVLVLIGASAAGAALGAWQAVGVVAVGVGIVLVRGAARAADSRGVALALLIGATIAGYTLVDKRGIEHAAPIPYLELVLAPVAIAALGWQFATGRADALRAEVAWTSVAASVCSFAAYAFVLAALARASAPAVAAVRETSILFAVALGALALREPVGRTRAVGAAVVVLGVALVALG
jgi:drug/metabolite transporter (DMT)-like permease